MIWPLGSIDRSEQNMSASLRSGSSLGALASVETTRPTVDPTGPSPGLPVPITPSGFSVIGRS